MKKILALMCMLTVILASVGCRETFGAEAGFSCETVPLERNGISLHLDYQDYSLVRRLAGEGYAVWRIDIAGYRQSEPGEGFTKASQKISTHLLKVLTIRV